MNILYKNENTIFSLSPMDIQNGRDIGLTKLTGVESANWLTGKYEIMGGEIVEKTVTPLTIEEVQYNRTVIFADPVNGSDKLFIEYQASLAKGSSVEVAEEKKTLWLTRRDEIKAEHPFTK